MSSALPLLGSARSVNDATVNEKRVGESAPPSSSQLNSYQSNSSTATITLRKAPHLLSPVVVDLSPARVWLVRLLPLIAGTAWLGTPTSLLIIWATIDHHKRYKDTVADVPFLSHVGGNHPALFLAGCIVTSVFWFASYAVERMLRYEHLLMTVPEHQARRKAWLILGWIDLVLVFFGASALILVATFNFFTSSALHAALAAIFALFLVLSGAIQIAELRLLFRTHPRFRTLQRNIVLKTVILIIAVLALVSYEALNLVCPDASVSELCWYVSDGVALCEWVACYAGGVYLLSLSRDLWPVERYASPSDLSSAFV